MTRPKCAGVIGGTLPEVGTRVVRPARKGALLTALAACAVLFCACAMQPLAVTREPASLRVVAAESVAPMLEELGEAYEVARPWVNVEISEYSSALSEDVLREGSADLAILTWLEDRPGEASLWSTPFRRDGIAVVLHPTTRLPGSSLGHLQEVFRGRVQEWEGIVLVVVSREQGSGTRAAFEATVLGYHPVTLNAVVASSSSAVIETVASTPGAIGYVSTLRLAPEDLERVRILPVDGVLPSPERVGDERYLLWRQMFVAAMAEPTGEAREFVQFILGPKGQVVAAQFESRVGIGG